MNDTYSIAPSNIVVSNSSNVTFNSCSFVSLGANGVSVNDGSKHITFSKNHFEDISGAALILGDINDYDQTNSTATWNEEITIADNTIINLPQEYSGQSQLFAGYVEKTSIIHNYFSNATYSAITIGWGWGREASLRGNNVIAHNKITQILRERCCDGGAIYTIGPQVGSSIHDNYLLQSSTTGIYPAGGNALYHDRGSGGFLDSNNVVDGNWTHWFGTNPSQGQYGPGAHCPTISGEEGDCNITITKNFLRTLAGGADPPNNSTIINDNIVINMGSPLPPEAQIIYENAGVRADEQ